MVGVEEMQVINGLLAMLTAALAAACVFLDRIPDRFVARVGLATISVGQFVTGAVLLQAGIDDGALTLLRAQFLVRVGLIVLGVAVVTRFYPMFYFQRHGARKTKE